MPRDEEDGLRAERVAPRQDRRDVLEARRAIVGARRRRLEAVHDDLEPSAGAARDLRQPRRRSGPGRSRSRGSDRPRRRGNAACRRRRARRSSSRGAVSSTSERGIAPAGGASAFGSGRPPGGSTGILRREKRREQETGEREFDWPGGALLGCALSYASPTVRDRSGRRRSLSPLRRGSRRRFDDPRLDRNVIVRDALALLYLGEVPDFDRELADAAVPLARRTLRRVVRSAQRHAGGGVLPGDRPREVGPRQAAALVLADVRSLARRAERTARHADARDAGARASSSAAARTSASSTRSSSPSATTCPSATA